MHLFSRTFIFTVFAFLVLHWDFKFTIFGIDSYQNYVKTLFQFSGISEISKNKNTEIKLPGKYETCQLFPMTYFGYQHSLSQEGRQSQQLASSFHSKLPEHNGHGKLLTKTKYNFKQFDFFFNQAKHKLWKLKLTDEAKIFLEKCCVNSPSVTMVDSVFLWHTLGAMHNFSLWRTT